MITTTVRSRSRALRHLALSALAVLGVIAVACVPPVGTVDGDQVLDLTATGRRPVAISAPVPVPGFDIGLAEDGRLAALDRYP